MINDQINVNHKSIANRKALSWKTFPTRAIVQKQLTGGDILHSFVHKFISYINENEPSATNNISIRFASSNQMASREVDSIVPGFQRSSSNMLITDINSPEKELFEVNLENEKPANDIGETDFSSNEVTTPIINSEETKNIDNPDNNGLENHIESTTELLNGTTDSIANLSGNIINKNLDNNELMKKFVMNDDLSDAKFFRVSNFALLRNKRVSENLHSINNNMHEMLTESFRGIDHICNRVREYVDDFQLQKFRAKKIFIDETIEEEDHGVELDGAETKAIITEQHVGNADTSNNNDEQKEQSKSMNKIKQAQNCDIYGDIGDVETPMKKANIESSVCNKPSNDELERHLSRSSCILQELENQAPVSSTEWFKSDLLKPVRLTNCRTKKRLAQRPLKKIKDLLEKEVDVCFEALPNLINNLIDRINSLNCESRKACASDIKKKEISIQDSYTQVRKQKRKGFKDSNKSVKPQSNSMCSRTYVKEALDRPEKHITSRIQKNKRNRSNTNVSPENIYSALGNNAKKEYRRTPIRYFHRDNNNSSAEDSDMRKPKIGRTTREKTKMSVCNKEARSINLQETYLKSTTKNATGKKRAIAITSNIKNERYAKQGATVVNVQDKSRSTLRSNKLSPTTKLTGSTVTIIKHSRNKYLNGRKTRTKLLKEARHKRQHEIEHVTGNKKINTPNSDRTSKIKPLESNSRRKGVKNKSSDVSHHSSKSSSTSLSKYPKKSTELEQDITKETADVIDTASESIVAKINKSKEQVPASKSPHISSSTNGTEIIKKPASKTTSKHKNIFVKVVPSESKGVNTDVPKVDLREIYQPNNYIFLVSELFNNDALFQYVKNLINTCKSKCKYTGAMKKVINGVQILRSSKELVYKELSPENILINASLPNIGKFNEDWHEFVTVLRDDFGHILSDDEELQALGATPGCLVPVILKSNLVGFKSRYKLLDVWAYCMMVNTLFWRRKQMVFLRYFLDLRYSFKIPEWEWADEPEVPHEILRKFLNIAVHKNMNLKQIFLHPLLKAVLDHIRKKNKTLDEPGKLIT